MPNANLKSMPDVTERAKTVGEVVSELKDELKEFIYSQEGTAKIRTDLGELDTVIVASQRTGNNRILRMWFAPSLGYVPVQAERTRDGKLEFAMRIKTLKQ